MPVNVCWVIIDGEQLLSISLPRHQHVTIAPGDGWLLLLQLRAALRAKPGS